MKSSSALVLVTCLLVISILGFLDSSVPAKASNVALPFEDGFENIANNEYPSSNGWSVQFAGASAYVSTARAETGSKSFRQYSSGYARADGISINMPNKLNISVDVYIEAVNGPGAGSCRIGFFEKVSAHSAHEFNLVGFNLEDNTILAVGAKGSSSVYLQDFELHRWYHVETCFDFTANKMNISIDGVLRGIDIDAEDEGTTNVFVLDTSDSTVFYDNIRIEDDEGSGSDPTPPTALFVVVPVTGDTDTEFIFDASSCYDYEDLTPFLEVRWDWENDGTWDTSFTTSKTASHQYEAADTHIVRLEVQDTSGLSSSTTKSLIVNMPPEQNTPPEASFTISPSGGDVHSVYEFDASSCYDSSDSIALLEVRWDWENNGVWDTDYSSVKTAAHQYHTEGLYTIRLEVKDSGGLVNATTKKLQVTLSPSSNYRPTASFTFVYASNDLLDIFNFDAQGCFDEEDSLADLEVRWDWENDGVWDLEFSVNKIVTHHFNTTGTFTVKLEVKDSGGLTDNHTRKITIPKVITSPMAFFDYHLIGNSSCKYTFDSSNSSDREDDASILMVRWDWESDGVWDTPYMFNKTIDHEFNGPGKYRVTLEVKDNDGLISITTREIEIESPILTFTPDSTACFTIGSFIVGVICLALMLWWRR